MREQGVQPGGVIRFTLPELELDGPADVLAVEPCPAVQPGRGRVITGTFATARCEALQIRLAGRDEVLEPTPPHRFYSETRQDWVAAKDLRPGERLRTASGEPATVESVGLKPGRHAVYNLEVESEHQFFVGQCGALVHNAYTGRYTDLGNGQELRTCRIKSPRTGGIYYRKLRFNTETGEADFSGFYLRDAKGKPVIQRIRYTGDREASFRFADSARGVPQEEGYTRHHLDYDRETGMGRMVLVQTDVHRDVGHTGAFAAANGG